MFKAFRVIIVVIFAVSLAAFGWSYAKEHIGVDETIPIITVPEGTLEVKLDAKGKDFLEGVTAFDEKDGDLTDKLIIESISKFSDVKNGICKVTYAVCDNDNHVVTASRKVKYLKYTSPKFTATRSLCYSVYEAIDLTEVLGAVDCIEGDVSNEVVITSTDFESGLAGSYSVNLKLTTVKGDLIEEKLPLIVEDRPLNAPTIELKNYLVYIKKGSKFDPQSYIKKAYDAMELPLTGLITVDSNVKVKKAGVYNVHYYVNDSMGRQGHTTLTVIVK